MLLETERAGGAKGRILAERMPGDVSGLLCDLKARFVLQHPQRRDARGHQSRLGVGGQGEFGLRALEHQLG